MELLQRSVELERVTADYTEQKKNFLVRASQTPPHRWRAGTRVGARRAGGRVGGRVGGPAGNRRT